MILFVYHIKDYAEPILQIIADGSIQWKTLPFIQLFAT